MTAADECGMNDKRAAYILEKWSDKGWYDYGVSLRAGWLTTEGLSVDCDGLFINASVLPCNET